MPGAQRGPAAAHAREALPARHEPHNSIEVTRLRPGNVDRAALFAPTFAKATVDKPAFAKGYGGQGVCSTAVIHQRVIAVSVSIARSSVACARFGLAGAKLLSMMRTR